MAHFAMIKLQYSKTLIYVWLKTWTYTDKVLMAIVLLCDTSSNFVGKVSRRTEMNVIWSLSCHHVIETFVSLCDSKRWELITMTSISGKNFLQIWLQIFGWQGVFYEGTICIGNLGYRFNKSAPSRWTAMMVSEWMFWECIKIRWNLWRILLSLSNVVKTSLEIFDNFHC